MFNSLEDKHEKRLFCELLFGELRGSWVSPRHSRVSQAVLGVFQSSLAGQQGDCRGTETNFKWWCAVYCPSPQSLICSVKMQIL